MEKAILIFFEDSFKVFSGFSRFLGAFEVFF
jgi:hypothetical protein